MSDFFSPIPIEQLTNLVIKGVRNGSLFGVSEKLFYKPKNEDVFKLKRFNSDLQTPFGVAAGPQTQLAQNIILAWITGARYIELKTVQTLDELEIAKPCIDMQDEGYNCEWSQELKLNESFDEYLNAWIIIHILSEMFSFENHGCIFNMSVGYNLDGILKKNVQTFFDKMQNCTEEKHLKIEKLKAIYPNIVNLKISNCISDNITLSTMHGCPAGEIEEIASYLICEKKFHTTVKLNPTLLGAEKLRNILNKKLKFKSEVPDIAFEHDLKYPDALNIIRSLHKKAKENNVFFGLKLTNTLETVNNKDVFSKENEMMYLSGRALHPISVAVAEKLQTEFEGNLDISFSAGADAFNVTDLIACGLKPVTVSSDFLKPGGYARMAQYINKLRETMKVVESNDIDDFIKIKSGSKTADLKTAILFNLKQYATQVVEDKRYKRDFFVDPSIKTKRTLNPFDCIAAPCNETCPTNQNIPQYMYHTSRGEFDKAFEVILNTNPFPSVTGMVCDHLCQTKCTRINYDNSLLIRDIKRFITENISLNLKLELQKSNGLKVAIIGAGPSGLSCAYFLAKAGFLVEVFETKTKAGGMVSSAIPSFRLTNEALLKDIQRIESMGVKINFDCNIDKSKFEKLQKDFDYLYLAAGAQAARKISVSGSDSKGVLDPLQFLDDVKNNIKVDLGKNIIIMGGGNTAMDVARTVNRIVSNDCKVKVIYRRSKEEMPAEYEEVKALIDEGIEIVELVDIKEIKSENNKIKSLVLLKMQLGKKDSSGRRSTSIIEGSEFEIQVDTLIPAVGQDLNIDFIKLDLLKTKPNSFETLVENLFIGGDAKRGASTVIQAIADGRKTSIEILKKANIQHGFNFISNEKDVDISDLKDKKSVRKYGVIPHETDLKNRKNFNLVNETLTKEHAIEEASRCLLCDELCDICTTVCPNAANQSYQIERVSYKMKKAIVGSNNLINFVEDDDFVVNQKNQVLNIGNWCNECGNCATFCPTSGAPYIDKPKFYLTSESFYPEQNAYYIEKNGSDKKINLNCKEGLLELSLTADIYIFKSKDFIAKFDSKSFEIKEFNNLNINIKEFNFRKAAEMSVLLKGAEYLY